MLNKCLESLFLSLKISNISKHEYEIIIADDSSSYETEEFILNKNYENLRIVKGKQRGPAANRNIGASLANGDWLIFLDDDCLPDSGLISEYMHMIQEGNVDVVEGCIYSDTNIPLLFTAPQNKSGGYLWSCNFAIKVEVFNFLDGFDELFIYPNLEDNDLYRRILNNNFRVKFNYKASVYHPPRPIIKPFIQAKYHSSWIYFHRKHGSNKSIFDLLYVILLNRTREIWVKPKSVASFVAFYFMVLELFFTFKNYRNENFENLFVKS